MSASKLVKLRASKILDLALPMPQMGKVNFEMLYSLLNFMVKQLHLDEVEIQVDASSMEELLNTDKALALQAQESQKQVKSKRSSTSHEIVSKTRVEKSKHQNGSENSVRKSGRLKLTSKSNEQVTCVEKLNDPHTISSIRPSRKKINVFDSNESTKIPRINSKSILSSSVPNSTSSKQQNASTDQISSVNKHIKAINNSLENIEEKQHKNIEDIKKLYSDLNNIQTSVIDLTERNNAVQTTNDDVMKSEPSVPLDMFYTVKNSIDNKIKKVVDIVQTEKVKNESAISKLRKDINMKISRNEMETLRREVRTKLDEIDGNVSCKSEIRLPEASGGTIEYIKNVNCISCNQMVKLRRDQNIIPEFKPFKSTFL